MAKILIIGGGVSGLSAGIYAQLSGHQAIICEKHSIAGGNLTGWQRGDYHIDNCIHWLTGTNPNTQAYRMWKELGALDGVKIIQEETLYTCRLNGSEISLNKDIRKTENDMISISGADEKEIRALFRAVETVQGLSGIMGDDHREKLSAYETVIKAPSLLKYINMTTGALAKRFKHPLLRFFIGSLLGESFGAIALIVVFATFCGENGGIPEGGSLQMAINMSKRFKALGGELLTGKSVTKIVCSGNQAHSVILSDGSRIDADYFIVTADPATVFGHLLDRPMPGQLQGLYDNPRLVRFSSFHCAFSCNASDLTFKGDLALPIPPRHRKLLRSDVLVLREFSHEKRFAPDGKTVLQALCFCMEDFAKEFITLRRSDREKYKEFKQSIAKAFEEIIVEALPLTPGSIDLIDSWTPATYHRYTGSEIGSFMGFAIPPRHLLSMASNHIRGLTNVVLATQWQQPPGGLPIAAECGRYAIESINKEEAKASQGSMSRKRSAAEKTI